MFIILKRSKQVKEMNNLSLVLQYMTIQFTQKNDEPDEKYETADEKLMFHDISEFVVE